MHPDQDRRGHRDHARQGRIAVPVACRSPCGARTRQSANILTDRFMKAWDAAGHAGALMRRGLAMSVSSVASPPAVVMPNYDSKPQDSDSRDAAAAYQPPPPAPLPPGQGTRIDQIA